MHLIEKGSTFEVYRGLTGALRMDWTVMGALGCTYEGQIEAPSDGLIAQRLGQLVRTSSLITMLHDFWEASSCDTQFRVNLTQWAKLNPGKLAAVHALSGSKILNMQLSVWGSALPEVQFKVYAKRSDFDMQRWAAAGI